MRKFYQTIITLILVFTAGILFATEIGTDVKVGSNANSARFPQITYCSLENKFLLIWNGNESGYDRIYYNFLDEAEVAGTPTSTGTLLSTSSTGAFRYSEKPQVAYDSSSATAAVVWQESNALGKDSVVLSILNVNSESESTEVVVAGNSTWNMSATVASNNMGKYLVTYYDTTSLSITGKFYNSSGVQVGSDLLLGSVGSGYLFPYSIDIAYNSIDDVFVVVWADYSSNMFSILVKSDGTIGGSNDYSSISAVGNPAIAYNHSLNNFLIVYDDFSGNVSGVIVDSVGELTGESYSFGNSSALEAEPDVSYNSQKEVFAVTWSEYLGDAGIWLQELLVGDCSFKTDSVKIDDATSTSNSPALAYGTSDGNYWVTWFGEAEGKDQIYLQRYSSDFKLVNAISKDIIVSLNDSGFYALSANEIDSASIAICDTPVLSIDRDTLWCSDLPSVSVMLVASNSSGISDTAYATVTIRDTLSIECPGDQFEFVNSNCEYEIPDYSAQVAITSSCSIDTLIQTPEAGSFVQAGDTTITVTVKVGSLISDCSFNLNVTGVTSDFTSDLVSGCKGTEISFTDLSSENVVDWLWDFGDGSPLDSTQNPFHVYTEPGNYVVSLKVNNAIGCTDSISKEAYITIHPPLARFTANPTFGLTLPHTVFFTDQSTLPDTWFWDFGDGSTSTAQNPIHSYTAFGSYKVLLTVTDTIYGCSDTVSTVINVAQDTTPPDFNCPIDTFAYADVDCQAELGDYTLAANIVDDYDPSPVIEQYPAAGTMFSDSIWVTIKASDFSANIDSCSFWVIASDTINPVVSCKDSVLYLGETGQVTLNAYDIDNGSTDNCGIASMELSQSVFTGGDAGINTVGLIVTDVNGNSATCNFHVTIRDTIAPEITCQGFGIVLDKDGYTRIYPGFALNSAYDAGGIVSYSLDKVRYNCSDVGENTVTVTVKDYAGNIATCTSDFTIFDAHGPEISCKDIDILLNAQGVANVDPAMVDDGSSDACGIAGMELSQSTFTGADLGENAVYLYVTDVNGNTDSCLAVVTVSDEIAPVANCNSIDVFVNDMSGYALNSVDLAMLAAGSTDNATSFDSLTIEASPSVFTCEQIGDSVTVEITVIDEAGNESSCETTVFVNYQLAIEVEDIEVSLDSGQCETAVSYPGVFTSESCAVLTQLEGLGAEGMFPAGTTVETWEVVLGESIDTVSFSVVVTPVEFAPTLNTVNDTTVSEDEVLVVELTGISDGGDCLPQELVISAESLNADLIESIAVTYEQGDSTAELSITFIAEQSGEAEVVVLVEDESGAIVTDTFAVIVESVNDAPTLVAAIADRDVQAEDVLSVSISRTLGDVFDDADGDELSWIFMSEEDTVYSWMSVNELASEYVLDFSPTQADTGCYTIIVQVSDTSGLTASDSFEVCVTAIPVGVANIDQSAFNVNIYPNPSKGLVSIEMETSSVEETEVSVSNVAGAEVLRRTFIAGDHIQLDLSENVSGMYLMRITQGGKHAIKKLILDKN
nr:PKD domain-containing protein [uncultured Draconibacterium sp.]